MFGRKASEELDRVNSELDSEKRVNESLRKNLSFSRLDLEAMRSSQLSLIAENQRLERRLKADGAEHAKKMNHLRDSLYDSFHETHRSLMSEIEAQKNLAKTYRKAYDEDVPSLESEIVNLKADIAEQVRTNRQYAEEIGNQRDTINALSEKNMRLSTVLKTQLNETFRKSYSTSGYAVPCPPDFNSEASVPDTADSTTVADQVSDLKETLNKRAKAIKRLKAKVKKLTSDNKAMAAEILHSRNSM